VAEDDRGEHKKVTKNTPFRSYVGPQMSVGSGKHAHRSSPPQLSEAEPHARAFSRSLPSWAEAQGSASMDAPPPNISRLSPLLRRAAPGTIGALCKSGSEITICFRLKHCSQSADASDPWRTTCLKDASCRLRATSAQDFRR